MKKLLSIIALVAACWLPLHAQDDATISADQIQYWIGSGSNEAILIVNWCQPEVAFAWGYRFDGDEVTVEMMMNDITAADSRLDYEGSSGFLNEITYLDADYNLSLSGSYWMYNLNGSLAQLGFTAQLIADGDVVKWGDDGCADVDWDTWSYTWTTVVTPASDPNASTNVDAVIASSDVQYWIGNGANEALFMVSWCEPAVALAWGYRFDADSVLVSTLLEDIAAADTRLSVAIGDGWVNDITYQDDVYNLAVAPDYIVYNINGGYANAVGEQYFYPGDYIKFGGYGCAQMDADWVSTWNTEVLPVSIPENGGGDTIPENEFDGIVGSEGCQAIFCQDPAILGWATNCQITRGLQDITTEGLWASYGTESDAVGASTTSTTEHVVSLGDNGVAILTFDQPIQNGEGYDFAVFENALNDTFLELAFVEVSSDGINYVRFPAVSNTQIEEQITNAGSVNACDLHNLAGKYRVGWGVPFDLEELADSAQIDINNITHVKVIDVIGTIDPEYASRDSRNHIINDPYPTNFASCGFDLSGVCILNGWTPGQASVAEYESQSIGVYPNPCISTLTVESVANELVQLFNAQGALVMSQKANGEQTTLNVNSLPNGIYFVQCGGKSAKVMKM